MAGFLIALVSGALMSIQGVFNTEVTKQSSVWVSASWVQFSALMACLLIWAVFDHVSHNRRLPHYNSLALYANKSIGGA